MDFNKYIEIDSNKRFGKPVIKGTRIAVADILNWLANGMSADEIINDFPELQLQDIRISLLFAAQRERNLGIAS